MEELCATDATVGSSNLSEGTKHNMTNRYLKLYIAVLNEVPDYIVPTLVAHAVLGAHLDLSGKGIDTYDSWVKDSFRKCVVSVNKKEFDKIALMDNTYKAYENTTLGGSISCLVPLPQWSDSVPNVLKFAKLWKPK